MARMKTGAKPKKDFILKASDTETFVEKENRTTIAAIIAIVAIVIVVATIMKVQPFDFFGTNGNLQGSASAESFVGTRYVDLVAHETLVAKMNMGAIGQRTYNAYLEEGVFVTSWPSGYSQSLLTTDASVPGIYYAEYPDGDRDVSVVVVESSSQLILDGLFDDGQSLVLTVIPSKVYDGVLSVAGEEFYFQLSGYELVISYAGGRDIVTLTTADDGMLTGSWWWKDANHEVLVNPEEALVILHDVY